MPPHLRHERRPSPTHRHSSCRSTATAPTSNPSHNASSGPVIATRTATTKWRLALGWICLTAIVSSPPRMMALPSANALPLSSSSLPPKNINGPQPLLIPLTRLIPQKDPNNQQQRQTTSSSVFKKRSSATSGATSISVTTVGRVGYAGHILIGTPPQRLSVLFDTGSDLALVISDQCQGLECPELTHFSCLNSASCVDLGGGVGARVRSNVVVETELATKAGELKPVPVLAASGGDVGGFSSGEKDKNGGVSVRAETSRLMARHEGQKQGQQEQPQQRRDDLGHHNADPSTLQDRLRSSKTLPPSLSQPPPSTDTDPNAPMSAARLVGPGAVKIEDNLQLIHDNHAFSVETVHSAASSPIAPSTPPPSNFYNQTYVDGSWGAGAFVQDRIQVDTTPPGEVFNPNHHLKDDGSFESSSTGHVATVTFLNVVQDNLGLVKGYDGQVSGLLGLTRASPTGRKTFLQELVDQGSLAQPVVSMHLEMEGGSFLLGGIDSTQYFGEMVYSPVTDPVTWQMSLQGLGIRYRDGHYSPVFSQSSPIPVINSSGTGSNNNNNNNNKNNRSPTNTLPSPPPLSPNANSTIAGSYKFLPQLNVFQDSPLILDSGTSSILIPTDASQAIHKELGGSFDPIHQAWFLPCEGPDLIWWISSEHGIIQPYESLIYLLEDGRCQSLIFENPGANYWILGDTWLRGLYVVYDMAGRGRIGIATANVNGLNSTDHGAKAVDGGEARILTVKDSSSGGWLRPSVSGVGVALALVAVHALVGALV